jgi:hypothetical protein
MAKQTFTTGQVLTAAQMTSLQQTAMGGGSTTAKTVSYTLVAADAGTVIQMNSASATTITVNTGLFAAGDTVQIQNIGAGVCTVTAGTATVNTSATLALKQYDAGTLYFNTTSAAFFFAVDAADGGATGAGCYVYKSANQSIPNATFTSVTWDAEWTDSNNIHSTSTNTDRFTVQAGQAGYYFISVNTNWQGSAVGARQLIFAKNGTLNYGEPKNGTPNAGGELSMVNSAFLNLAVGDYITVSAYQTSGGALNIEGGASGNNRSFCSFMYLGA